jgi:tRNA(Arg) A34 adenosine deaminase TadA
MPTASNFTSDLSSDFMALAFAQAEAAGGRGEVPIGAVIVDPTTGEVLAAAGNETEARADPTAHAEMLAIRAAAAKVAAPRLAGCDLYVTLEPCPMCATAASFARLRRVIFGAYDPKGGGVEHGARIFEQVTCHHRPEVVGGVAARRAEALLKGFFAARR